MTNASVNLSIDRNFMSEKKEQILQSATRMIRGGGYNAFSFREIADEVGIKSSSVHHYFRRKEDLAVVVAERYSDAFLSALGDPLKFEDSESVIFHYSNVIKKAFKSSGKACLCGILSHESPMMPESVAREIASFVDNSIDWLTAALSFESNKRDADALLAKARVIYVAFSGAMAVATLNQDISWIQSVQDYLTNRSQ